MEKRKQIIFFIVVVIFAMPFIFSKFYSTNNTQSKPLFERRDIEDAAGLLMPTDESIPEHFKANKQYYGFGSNDGCYSATYWEKYDTRFYCFRFFDPTTAEDNGQEYKLDNAETLKFEAYAVKNNAPVNLDAAAFTSFLKNLDSKGILHTEESFTYKNVEGSIVSFSVDRLYGNEAYPGTRLKVKKMFWKDGETYITILWSKPGSVPESEKLVNILPTLRRSNGTSLE